MLLFYVPFTAEPVLLSEQQRCDLNEIAQSRSLPASFVFRAKLILMLAEGLAYSVIQGRLQTTQPTISRLEAVHWRRAWKDWIPPIPDRRPSY
jgi:hypothetical protein